MVLRGTEYYDNALEIADLTDQYFIPPFFNDYWEKRGMEFSEMLALIKYYLPQASLLCYTPANK